MDFIERTDKAILCNLEKKSLNWFLKTKWNEKIKAKELKNTVRVDFALLSVKKH